MNDMKLRSISDLLSFPYPREPGVGSALSANFHQHSTCQPIPYLAQQFRFALGLSGVSASTRPGSKNVAIRVTACFFHS
jgi:hypothetical protein